MSSMQSTRRLPDKQACAQSACRWTYSMRQHVTHSARFCTRCLLASSVRGAPLMDVVAPSLHRNPCTTPEVGLDGPTAGPLASLPCSNMHSRVCEQGCVCASRRALPRLHPASVHYPPPSNEPRTPCNWHSSTHFHSWKRHSFALCWHCNMRPLGIASRPEWVPILLTHCAANTATHGTRT